MKYVNNNHHKLLKYGLSICCFFLLLSTIMPIQNYYGSFNLSADTFDPNELELFWHAFQSGDIQIITLMIFKIALTVILILYLIRRNTQSKIYWIYLIIVPSIILLILDSINDNFNHFAILLNDFGILESSFYSKYLICSEIITLLLSISLIGILISTIYGLFFKRNIFFFRLHIVSSLVFFSLYYNSIFTSNMLYEVPFEDNHYLYFSNFVIFFIGIFIFALFSFFGIKIKLFNVGSILLFVVSFFALPFSALQIFGGDGFIIGLFLFTYYFLNLMPLLFIISISSVIFLSRYSKDEKTVAFAEPEMNIPVRSDEIAKN